MTRQDINLVEISEEMLSEAKQEAAWLGNSKVGQKTRNAAEDRDIIGSLAHQAVEQKLSELGLYYESTRKVKYEKGDAFDILYENDFLDVKGSKGIFNEKYFYNREFCVFQEQLDDPKIETISHFCFVEISPFFDEAFIYGVVERNDFLERAISKPQTESWKWPSMGIRAYQLRPFLDYVFRTPTQKTLLTR